MPTTRRSAPGKTPTRPRKRSAGEPPRRLRRNRPAGERSREMLDAAMELFSHRGMSITIQSLADRIHVTQPLVHRYFPTKADLIGAICREISEGHWDPVWREVLTDRSRLLEERIPDFYRRYLPHIYQTAWYRGFLYVALHDPRFADSYLKKVDRELLYAIIGEVRALNGFPSIADIPVHERELELVWGMHSTLIFHGIRRYVYEMAVSDDVPTIIRDQMRAYLLVAPLVMAELMPPGRRAAAKAPPLKAPRLKAVPAEVEAPFASGNVKKEGAPGKT